MATEQATPIDHVFQRSNGPMKHLCSRSTNEGECLRLEGEHPVRAQCGIVSSVSATRCELPSGHPPWKPNRFHKFPEPTVPELPAAAWSGNDPLDAEELTLDDLRSVDSFRAWMIFKLDQNRHKGNRAAWIDPERFPMEQAVARLVEEVAELLMAVATGASAHKIIGEAADVGNLAMMIADKTGELRTLKP